MPKEIKVTLYLYDELEPKGRRLAIDRHRDINTRYLKWWDETFHAWRQRLEHVGFGSCEILFSGFYSQGDGASFLTGTFNAEAFLMNNRLAFDNPTAGAVRAMASEFSGRIYRANNHFTHKHAVTLELHRYVDDDEDPLRGDIKDRLLEALKVQVEATRIALCDTIYTDLLSRYESLQHDNNVAQTLKYNGYYFYSDGRMYERQ